MAMIIILLGSLLLTGIWFSSGSLMGAGESGLPFYSLLWHTIASEYSWKLTLLGNANGITTGSFPLYWFLSRFVLLGVPNFLIQAFFFFTILSCAGIGIFLLSRLLFKELPTKYHLLAVGFYWFNPATLVNVWSRFLNNYMVFFALLPLALYLFIKGLEKRSYIYALSIGLVTAGFSYALTAVPFNLILWMLFALVTAYYAYLNNRVWFYLQYFLIALLSYCLINAWWIGQFFSYLYSTSGTVSINDFFSSSGNLGTLDSLSQKLGLLINTLRFMHSTYYLDKSTYTAFYTTAPMVLLEFSITFLILGVIFRYRRHGSVLLLAIIYFLGLYLTKGNQTPFGDLFQIAFLYISALQVFRNPFEKFSFLLSLTAAPLFSFAIYHLGQHYLKHQQKIYLLAVLWLVGIWGSFYWSGLLFTRKDGNSNQLVSYQTEVPEYYQKTNQWLEGQGDNFRFVVLPIGGEGMSYAWPKSYSGIELSASLFQIPNISYNTSVPFYNDLVHELVQYQSDRQLINFVPFLTAHYLVWRGDIDYKDRRLANPTSVKSQLDDWTKEGLLTKAYENGLLAVYKLPDRYNWQRIYLSDAVVLSNEINLAKVAPYLDNFPTKKTAIVNYQFLKESDLPTKLLISPEHIFLPQVTAQDSSLTEDDLLARLFHAEHLPGDRYYPLIKFKEFVQSPFPSDHLGWVLYHTGILGKRAVEVYQLHKQNASPELIAQAESTYSQEAKRLKPILLSTLKVDTGINQVVKESLLYQMILLQRVKSVNRKDLSDIILYLNIKPEYDLPQTSSGSYITYRFDIPKTGDYQILSDSLQPVLDWYVDGEKVARPSELQLSVGGHELAVLVNNNLVNFPLVEQPNLEISNDQLPSWPIKLENLPINMRLSFDYKFVQGTSFAPTFSQDNDRPQNPMYQVDIHKNPTAPEWNHWSSEFSSTPGAKQGDFQFTPSQKTVCQWKYLFIYSCHPETEKFKVQIRNLQLTRVNYPQVMLSSQVPTLTNQNAGNSVGQWQRIDPTHYTVQIHKEDNQPQLLVFSELFSSGWQATYEDGSLIPGDKHLLVNSYANAWIIDRPGDHQVTLRFGPQKLLEVSTKISVISALVITGLIVLLLKKRRDR